MKIFDRDGDGQFDGKDLLLMVSVITTFMNLVLNLFSVLNLGVTFTNQEKPILDCRVVKDGKDNKLKCFRVENDVLPQLPSQLEK